MDPRARTFDQFSLGERFESGPRIVSQQDIDRFTELSGDRTELHTNQAWAEATPLGGIVAHGALNLSVATGLAFDMGIFRGTVLAFRSLTASFERPVYPGDHVRLELEVTGLEASRHVGSGLAEFGMTLRNQDGRRVVKGTWRLLLRSSEA